MTPRVLHLIPTLGGGGAERQLVLLARGLGLSGWEVHVASLTGGIHHAGLQEVCASVECLGARKSQRAFIPFRVAKTVRRVRPAVLQTWLPHMDVAAGPVAVLSRLPWVVSERASAEAYDSGWVSVVRRVLVRRADVVVANSTVGADYWAAHAPNVARRVIRNGVVLPPESEAALPESQRRRPAGSPMILCAGRLSPEKNLSRLIDSLARLREVGQEFVGRVFGDGTLLAQLHEQILAHERRLQCSLYTSVNGYSQELGKEYRSASVFVSVSLHEGSPNTVVEAASHRCPLVLSDIPPHRELFDSSSAVFVDPLSVESIANGINLALECASRSARRAEAAYRVVSQMSVERLVSDYASLYSQLLAKHGFKGGE
jgi:glycosyltransferase involved in cell wall biosynthesis